LSSGKYGCFSVGVGVGCCCCCFCRSCSFYLVQYSTLSLLLLPLLLSLLLLPLLLSLPLLIYSFHFYSTLLLPLLIYSTLHLPTLLYCPFPFYPPPPPPASTCSCLFPAVNPKHHHDSTVLYSTRPYALLSTGCTVPYSPSTISDTRFSHSLYSSIHYPSFIHIHPISLPPPLNPPS
jgi:hypothetical protein